MGRPPSDLDEYLDWQERLESYQASGLEVDVFCLQEGVSRSTYYRWVDQLKDGIPESMVAEKAARERVRTFFRTLPVALERNDLHVIHACWDDETISVAKDSTDVISL